MASSDDDTILSWAVDTDGDNEDEISLTTESKILGVFSLIVLFFVADWVFNGGEFSTQLLNAL